MEKLISTEKPANEIKARRNFTQKKNRKLMYDKEKFFFFCEYLESVILLKVSTLSRMNVSSSATIREKDRKWLYDYVDDDDVMWDEKRVNIKKIK